MPSLAEILAAKKLAAQQVKESALIDSLPPVLVETPIAEAIHQLGKQEEQDSPNETFSLNITLNKEQLLAKELAFAGKSFVLTGAAGTGKTTTQREIARSLLEQGLLSTHDFRIQGAGVRWTGPSVAFVAYTRIAAGNLARAIHKDPELADTFRHNVTTIHNLLEYTPETYWCYEEQKEKFRFIPRRNASNPLDITHLILEESSMVDADDLWGKLFSALRSDTQIIFLGDINQLQPVFGASILNYALTQLPVVELKEVYRQKGDSTILENAHNILNGRQIKDAPDFQILHGGDKQFSQLKMMGALANSFKKWEEIGEYDPEQDIILSPFNKQDLGTDNINKHIAQQLGSKRNAVVHEVIAGINKLYLAVGDKVMHNKRVGIIKEINRNLEYHGAQVKPAATNLTRFGTYLGTVEDSSDDFELLGYDNLDLDKLMNEEQAEDQVRQASHVVTLTMVDDDEEEVLSAVGDFSPQVFSLGYALTVHKAQGCEWRHVFIILHKDHSIMAHRELLYTAVTRASKKVYLIAKHFMIEKAIATQRVKGNSLADKIEFFNAKISLDKQVRCYK